MTEAKPKTTRKSRAPAKAKAKAKATSKAALAPTNGSPTNLVAEIAMPAPSSPPTNGIHQDLSAERSMDLDTSASFLSFSDPNPTPQEIMDDLNQLLIETNTKLSTAKTAETEAIAKSLTTPNDANSQAASRATRLRETLEKLIKSIEAEQAAIEVAAAKPTDTALSNAKGLATELRGAVNALVTALEAEGTAIAASLAAPTDTALKDAAGTATQAVAQKVTAVKLIEANQAKAAREAGLAAAQVELEKAKIAEKSANDAAKAKPNDVALQDAAKFATGLREGYDALVAAFNEEATAIANAAADPAKAAAATQFREALADAVAADKTALTLYSATPDDPALKEELESAAQALLAFTDTDVLTAKAALTKAIADEKEAIALYNSTPDTPVPAKTAAQEAMETAIRLREAMELLITEATIKYTDDELKELAKKDRLLKAGLGVIATITGSLYVLHLVLIDEKMQELLKGTPPTPLQKGMVTALNTIISKLQPIFDAFKKFQNNDLRGLTNDMLDAGVNIGYAIINLAEPAEQAELLKKAEMVSMVAGLVKKAIPLVLASMDMIDISLKALNPGKKAPFGSITEETKKIGEALHAALKAKTALREAAYETNVEAGRKLLEKESAANAG